MLDIEARTRSSTMIQELRVLDYIEGRGWVGLVCFESSGEDHVSFHIIFSAFSLNLHCFTCYVENTSFHFFVNIHLFTYEHNICMYIYFMYVYIFILVRTYRRRVRRTPPRYFLGLFWGKKIGAKK